MSPIGGSDLASDDFGPPEWLFSGFMVVFALVLVAGIFYAISSMIATRNMAKRRGASDQDANALALFGGENGTAVAYAVKDARPTAPGLSEARSSADVEERIRSVRELEAKGLVTAEQAAERVEEILRDV